MATLDELLTEASAASSPILIGPSKVSPGGVDPLGLRQINFDLMDKVLPDLNNVAGKLRPFILMSWAWRRVRVLLDQDARSGATDQEMRDFVDRVEAIYTWSQFLVDPAAGIPGGQALRPLIAGDQDSYRFGGDEWINRRDLRRTSTGLISPLNYGPGLRSMGWLVPTGTPGVLQPSDDLLPALNAFESKFSSALTHDAFNKFGVVTVARADVERWGDLWALGAQTAAEILAGKAHFFGSLASDTRKAGFALVRAAAEAAEAPEEVSEVRKMMADRTLSISETLRPTATAWRRVQTRQAFRLALEGFFYWIIRQLDDGPLTTRALAQRFVIDAGTSKNDAGRWFAGAPGDNPVSLLERLDDALRGDGETVPHAIKAALAFCLAEARRDEHSSWPNDRLPMKRAVDEFDQWKAFSPTACVAEMIEIWVLAQHAYWCVGRGLADARSRGKTLLRLRVVMDEGGWTLTPGTRLGNPPVATPDRLATALSLLRETNEL